MELTCQLSGCVSLARTNIHKIELTTSDIELLCKIGHAISTRDPRRLHNLRKFVEIRECANDKCHIRPTRGPIDVFSDSLYNPSRCLMGAISIFLSQEFLPEQGSVSVYQYNSEVVSSVLASYF